jgi:hypothetical protein
MIFVLPHRCNRPVARCLCIGIAALLTTGLGTAAFTDDRTDARRAEQPAKPNRDESGWQKVFRKMAADYEMVSDGGPSRKFPLKPVPLLRWSQPVRGGDDGAVYLWLDEGRPAVIGSIFAWPLPDGARVVAHELHALTTVPMHSSYQGKEVWWLSEPALDFRPVPGAPAPAATPPLRLSQMRTLGREFTARSIDRKESEWELRLLGQPLYRYEIDSARGSGAETERRVDDELLDGAILSFVQGTDPEILLIMEARRDRTRSFWQYALARFSDLQLIVKHQDVEVWRVGNSVYADSKAPYFVRNVDQRKPPADQEAPPDE